MTELFSKINPDDLKHIQPAVSQTLELLYNKLSLTRVNTVRSLILSLSNTMMEWNDSEREILQFEIKDKKELEKNLIDRYILNHVASILLLIDSTDLDLEDKKRIIQELSKIVKKQEKKIIL